MSVYFCYFIFISLWKRTWSFIWTSWISITQGCFVPCLVEIGPVVLEKKMKMWEVYRSDNYDNIGQRKIFDQKSGSGEDFLKILSMYFCFFLYYLPLKKSVVLYLNKVQYPLPKDAFFTVLVKMGPVVLEKRLLRYVNVFPLLHHHLPFENIWINLKPR